MDRRGADLEFGYHKGHAGQSADAIAAALEIFVAGLLEIESDGALRQKHLLELGADSIALAEISAFVEKRFGVTVGLRQLFEELLSIEDISQFVAESPASSRRQPAQATAPVRSSPVAGGRGLSDGRHAASQSLRQRIAEFMAQLLELPAAEVERGTSLLDLGADSVALAEVVGFVEDSFGVPLALRQLFEELLTVEAIAAYVEERRGRDVRNPLKGAADTARPDAEGAGQRAAHQSQTARLITQFVGELLETIETQILPDVALLELGADSIALAELVRFVDETFGVPLKLRQLFEELLTVRAIADFVDSRAMVRPAAAPARQRRYSPKSAARPEGADAFPARATVAMPVRREPAQPPATPRSPDDCAREIVARFAARTRGSRAAAERFAVPLCNNRRSLSLVRDDTAEVSYPIQAVSSKGAMLRDIDGNEYVDIAMGYGVHLFGHGPEFIQEAVRRQLERGIQLGPECDLTGEVAEGICELTGAERVLFCNSGTEAVMTAMRIARCAAGRPKIATFRNAYHGHFDGTLVVPTGAKQFDAQPMAGGTTAGMVSDNYVLTFDSPASLAFIEEHAHELAAVLVEPVQNRRPDLHATAFLQELRRITRKHGIILIFDEILVGFRIHVAGAQAWFGIDADMVAYAKIIGGGLPIGVVAGSREIMACVDGGLSFSPTTTPSERETIYTAGTYCKHPLAMASALAVIGEFRRNGNGIQEVLNRKSESFFSYLNDGIERAGAPIRVANFGSFFRFAERGNLSFVYQPRTMDLFNYGLMSRGVHVIEGGTCFLSTAHSSSDLEFVAGAVFGAARELREGGFWPEGDGTRRAPVPAPADTKADKVNRSTPAVRHPPPQVRRSVAELAIGVSFFGTFLGDDNAAAYDLILEVARRADRAGLEALWFPERHFHEFGGAFPNPSLIAAAVARETKSVAVRAGSVVAALHHPARIAEEWAVVDQLSGGRAGVAFASGWHTGDFVLARDGFADRREAMESSLQAVRALWRGEAVAFRTPDGQEVHLKSLPRTLQPIMPTWLASMGTPDTFRKAGELGVGILTNLVGQDVDTLARNIRIYREALTPAARANPAHGSVVVLLHTALAIDDAAIRAAARAPLKRYLASSIDLVSRIGQDQGDSPIARLSPEDRDFVFERGVDRYIGSRALIGSPAACEALLRRLHAAGVTEIASLIDFGLDEASVLQSVDALGALQERIQSVIRADEGTTEAAAARGRSSAPRTDVRSAAVAEDGTAPANSGSARVATTYNQRMLWLASQFDDAGDAFHIRTSLRLEGSLHVDILRDVLAEIAARHAALRARFAGLDGGEMEVMAAPTQPFHVVDLSRLPRSARDEEIESWFREDSARPFDLESDSLLRSALLKVAKDEHILVLTAHHSVFDSVTEQIVFSELSRLYNARVTGMTETLPPAVDFLAALEETSRREAQENMSEPYWRAIASACKPLRLPFDREPGALRTFEGARFRTAIGATDFQALRRCAAQHGATPFVMLLATYMLTLHEVCDQREITVGISRDMRAVGQRTSLVANLTNMLPIAVGVEAARSFREHVRNVSTTLLEAYEHAEFPFGRMLQFAEGQGWAQPPLVATCFNWDHRETPRIAELTVSLPDDPAAYVRFPLSLNAVQSADGLAFEWDFNTHLFDEETIRAIAGRFERSVLGIVRRQPQTAPPTPAPFQSMLERIVAQSRRTPDAVALEDTRGTVTYCDVDRQSDRIAAFLASVGVKAGDIVGLALPSSANAVVAMIGIWKAGAAFAALAPPAGGSWSDRAAQAVGIDLILVDGSADPGPGRRTLDECLLFDGAASTTRAPFPLPNALAYLIFTSGSTGSPKAAGIEHRNLAAYVDGLNERVGWNAEGRFLFVSPLHVDLGYSGLFPALAAGGTVLVCPPELRLDVPALAQFVREPCDHLKITPTHLSLLLEHPEGRQCLPRAVLLCGGEPLSWELVDAVWALQPDLSIFNHYGPAETTIGALAFRVPRGTAARAAGSVPIGTPLAGVTAELRSTAEAAASSGEAAEILIGGSTVGRGYLAQRDGQPLWSPHDEIYATGDLARRLESGELVFHGRVDEQVKVRGYRVDLAVIADALRRVPGVSSAQVHLNHEQQIICATVAARDPLMPVTDEKLLAHLSVELAQEWLPGRIVIVRAIAVGASGKAAAEPEGKKSGAGGGESAAIGEVLDIWREVFGQNLPDANVNFFELGGHSIQAIKIIARIKRQSGVRISIKDLFGSPTPRGLASMIEDRNARYQQGA